MKSAPLPSNEAQRLEALQRYDILDTAADRYFQDIVKLAAFICGTPIALVSLIDARRQWFKAKQGVQINETPRDIAFCAHGILQKDPLIVRDALLDDRFKDNPLVTQGPHIRFYAGVPLVTSDGFALGMLCVNDSVPRDLKPEQLEMLSILGGQVVALMEMHRNLNHTKSLEEHFRQITENIREVFWLTDIEKHQMIYISPAYEEIWGRTCQSLYENPKSFLEAIHPEDTELVLKALPLQMTGQYAIVYRIIRPDGSLRWIQDRAFPVKDAEGHVYRVAGIAEDITERKRLESAIHLSEKMSAVGQMAAGVAHEINNPLGVILGFAQASLKRLEPEHMLELPLKSIEREAVRCKTLVQELLTFSRSSKVDAAPMNLNEVVASALTLVSAQARLVQVGIKTEFAENLPRVNGNANQIQQIVINLANNAFDAMHGKGTLIVQTEKVMQGPTTWVCLRFIDSGDGIPPAILSRIFDPFFTTKEVGKGTGLGLALVHEIAVKHSGRVEVQSKPGRTEFAVWLPVLRVH